MTSPAVRPRWKKKRWAAALGLWLAVAYPLSAGPAYRAAQLRWVPWPVFHVVYEVPTKFVVDRLPEDVGGLWWYYVGWWSIF